MKWDRWIFPSLENFHFCQLQAQSICKPDAVLAGVATWNTTGNHPATPSLWRAGQGPGPTAHDGSEMWVTTCNCGALRNSTFSFLVLTGSQLAGTAAAMQWLASLLFHKLGCFALKHVLVHIRETAGPLPGSSQHLWLLRANSLSGHHCCQKPLSLRRAEGLGQRGRKQALSERPSDGSHSPCLISVGFGRRD